MANKKIEKPKIIFLGTPEFGAIILNGLIKNGFKPALVVTSPDKPVGRKQTLTSPPVKLIAQKNNISVEQPETIRNLKLKVKSLNPDLGIVAAYGQILPKEILDIPKFGFLNVHPSLLPKYRGPSPVQTAILEGDQKTGVTLMLIDEKMDHGPIIVQEEMAISEKESKEHLHNRLAMLGIKLLIETIPQWIGEKIKPRPQEEKNATFSEIITKERGRIDWQKKAETIERETRAFYPWPGSYAVWQKDKKELRIKVLKSRVLKSPEKTRYLVGKVLVVPQNEIGVQCGDGNFLVIERLKPEGKNEMGAEDFLRGYSSFIGTVLR